MEIIRYPKPEDWPELLRRPALDTRPLQERVAGIIQDIAARGDEAVREYTERFDRARLDSFEVSEAEWAEAAAQVPAELQAAIGQARDNIRAFHEAQRHGPEVVETMPGVRCWRKMVPIERVGLYIPGGTAPLFSTLLMLGVPARIAGCPEIVLCTPPQPDGRVNPVILFTAQLLGIRRLFKIGGVQAVAAMACGTESVPKVFKIFGPGNQYVTAAKQYVAQLDTAIDMPAGPSEVAVMADATCRPAFVAADLLSQAEHGADSQVLLLTTDEGILGPVLAEVERQVALLPRQELARQALAHSKALLLRDEAEMMAVANAYAPEHLIIASDRCAELAEQVRNAGSVFLGHLTPESAGDYASGTNHTLPTNGHARAYSGVSLDSFVKKITFQQISPAGLRALGPAVERMAAAESLEAHRQAVSIRLAALGEV